MGNIPDPKSLQENITKLQEGINNPTTVVDTPTPADAPTETPKNTIDELTDDQLAELAAKRGFVVSKNEPTVEDKQKAQQIEEVEKLRFAIEKNLITPERYSEIKSVIELDGLELTKKEFEKSFKAENPSASKEDIEQAYGDYYFINNQKKVSVINDEGGTVEELEPAKYDDRQVKWGQSRIQTKAERIKENAKAVLNQIDTEFNNYRAAESKAKEYAKSVETTVAEITPEKYHVSIPVGKETVNLSVDLGKEARQEITDYLVNVIGGYAMNQEKLPSKEDLKKAVDGFIRNKYSSPINERFYDYVKGVGVREGAVGANAPIKTENITGAENTVDELAKQAVANIPAGLSGLTKR